MPFTDTPLEVSLERGQGSGCPPGSITEAKCGDLVIQSEQWGDDILPPLCAFVACWVLHNELSEAM